MKKKLSVCLVAVLSFLSATAQNNNIADGRHSYMFINAGVAVPIMCYGSNDVNNPDAGFAKPGFIFDFVYAYRFNNTFGVTGSFFYGWNKAGNKTMKAVTPPASYRMYGFMAGPMLSHNFSNRWEGDIRLLAGVSRVFTPALQQGDAVWLNRYQANAFTWGGGIGLRYNLEGNAFLQLKADHINLKPHFKMKAGETGKSEQHMVLMNFDAGVGLKF